MTLCLKNPTAAILPGPDVANTRAESCVHSSGQEPVVSHYLFERSS